MKSMKTTLREIRQEISTVNQNAGETVFNPALTGALEELIAGELSNSDELTWEIADTFSSSLEMPTCNTRAILEMIDAYLDAPIADVEEPEGDDPDAGDLGEAGS